MKNKSFTLIELLVVIVIIGILAGVIMISTSSSIDKANFAKAQAFSSTIQNELLSNLVSGWSFDEGLGEEDNNATSSDVRDNWGNSHGTIEGVPILKKDDCFSKKCIQFNDDTDCIRIISFFENTLKGSKNVGAGNYDKNATISAWAKPYSLDATSRFVFADNNTMKDLWHFCLIKYFLRGEQEAFLII
ncbi:MAG: type II secretion system protein [Candidatus Pacebacteria bacterium]|nr:type II secretion system protein [Candidatus Paceibacterota bacterium]